MIAWARAESSSVILTKKRAKARDRKYRRMQSAAFYTGTLRPLCTATRKCSDPDPSDAGQRRQICMVPPDMQTFIEYLRWVAEAVGTSQRMQGPGRRTKMKKAHEIAEVN